MSALVGTYQRAVNRLLPYRALHTDLVAHELYYTFNDPTVEALIAGAGTDWTEGADALASPAGAHDYDGNEPLQVNESASVTNSSDVYIESAAANMDSGLPCTFRVIIKTSSTQWVRIFDPGDADTDVWFEAQSTDTAATLGNIGSDVLEARVTYPPPGLVAGSIGSGGGAAGQHNGYSICEFELPAAASRAIRIQLVDSNGGTVLNGTGNVVYIAEAEVLNGKVSQWTCRRTGRTFSQATAANQPFARPMGVKAFNGRRVLRFAGNAWLTSDDPASDWVFLYGATGVSIYNAFLVTGTLDGFALVWSTTTTVTNEGTGLVYDEANEHVQRRSNDATAPNVNLSHSTANGSTPRGTLLVHSWRALENNSPEFAFSVAGIDDTVAGNEATWGTGTPEGTLTIGAEPGGGGRHIEAWISDFAIYEARLTDDEDARVIEEFEAQNASSLSIPGCVHSVVAGEVDAADVWPDRSPAGNDATVTSTIDNVASSPSFKDSPVEVFDEAENAVANGVAASVPDLTADHAVIFTGQLRELTGGTDILWVFQNSADVNEYELWGVNGGQWRVERSADGAVLDAANVGSADTRPHTHSFVIESGERSAYLDGAALFSGVASTPGVMASDRFTVSSNSSAALGSSLAVSEVAVYDAAPTTYQRQLVERAQRRRMLGMLSLKLGFSLGRATAVPASGVVVPLAGTWDGCYCDAADGPVDVGSGKIHPWTALEGNDLTQANSADRGTLTTAHFGGDNAVLFNGVNEFMEQDAIATLLAGDDVPFTLAIDAHFLDVDALDCPIALGNSVTAGNGPYHMLRVDNPNTQWEVVKDGDGGAPVTVNGGTPSIGVHRLIMVFAGTTVTLFDNGTKVIDAAAQDTVAATHDKFTIATRFIQIAGAHAQIAVRHVAASSTAISDANAGTLDTAWS